MKLWAGVYRVWRTASKLCKKLLKLPNGDLYTVITDTGVSFKFSLTA